MIRVTLIPNTAGAGGPKVFEVHAVTHRLATQELELKVRDGRVCIQVIGDWQIDYAPSSLVAQSCEDVARTHDGRSVIVTTV